MKTICKRALGYVLAVMLCLWAWRRRLMPINVVELSVDDHRSELLLTCNFTLETSAKRSSFR